MLRAFVRKLGILVRRSSPEWHRRLTARGLDPLAAQVLGQHRELADAWRYCPRADWVIEVAVRAKVEGALIARGVRDVGEVAVGWPLVSPDSAAALNDAVEAWQRDELEREALLARIQPSLCALVELAPELDSASRALREASRWKQRARIQQAADAYDDAHRAIHWQLAERLRRAIPADALCVALLGQRSHPYR